jgi:hypothetical protein
LRAVALDRFLEAERRFIDPIESMGSANYWIAIFGEPVRGKAWAWMLTGHHLDATFTCAGAAE